MTDFNNFKAHVYGLLSALHELPPKFPLVPRRSPRLGHDAGWQDIERWGSEFKSTVNDTLADTYLRIARHTDALMQLTDDERILAPVRKLGSLTTAEITDSRDAAAEIGAISDIAGLRRWILKWIFGAFFIRLRRNQIVAPTTELEKHIRRAA
jgi:hypothetical protein